WQDVYMLRRHRRAVLGVHDRHARRAPKDFGQHALTIGIEMGHHHKSQAVVVRHGFEKDLERLDPTRRCSDANDPQIGGHGFRPAASASYMMLNSAKPFYSPVGESEKSSRPAAHGKNLYVRRLDPPQPLPHGPPARRQ